MKTHDPINARLIYFSSASCPFPARDLPEIVATSARNNRRDGLDGVLLFCEPHFLQILEGDREVISKTFLRIAQDERHEKITLVDFRETPERLFKAWAMKDLTPTIGAKTVSHDLPNLTADAILGQCIMLSKLIRLPSAPTAKDRVPVAHYPASSAR